MLKYRDARHLPKAIAALGLGIVLLLGGCASTLDKSSLDKTTTPDPQDRDTISTELPASVKALDIQLEADPGNTELLYQKASALAKADIWPETIKTVEKALERDDEDTRFWVIKGVAERKLGLIREAKSSYEAALNVEPQTPLAHFNLGILYDLYLNQPQKAIQHFETFQRLQSAPDQKVDLWLTELKQRLAKR